MPEADKFMARRPVPKDAALVGERSPGGLRELNTVIRTHRRSGKPSPGARSAYSVRVCSSCCFLINCCNIAISAAPLMPTIRTPLTASSGPSSFQSLLMTMSP